MAVVEIPCFHCKKLFPPSDYQRWSSRHGRRAYCSPECRAFTPTTEEWFRANTDSNLMWIGKLNRKGYGIMSIKRKSKLAHHVAWFLHYGEWPPKGFEIDHTNHDPKTCKLGNKCPHRRSVDVNHMKLVRHKDHTGRDRSNAGESLGARTRARFAAMTHCKQGHEFTPENTYRRLRGGRQCRQCYRDSGARWRAKKRAVHKSKIRR